MEEASQDRLTGTSSADGESVGSHDLTEKQLPPEVGRIVSANPSSDVAVAGPSRYVTEEPESSNTEGILNADGKVYDSSTGNWYEDPQYVNANSLQFVSPAICSGNSSVVFHSGYGFDTLVAYGQFPHLAGPLSLRMVDGRLYAPLDQLPMFPHFYPQQVSPTVQHVNPPLPVSQTELMTPGDGTKEGTDDNRIFGPESGPAFYEFEGEFGTGEVLPNQSNLSGSGSYVSPLTSSPAYAQANGVWGSHGHNVGQISQEHRQFHGVGSSSSSSTRRYQHRGSYQRSNYGGASISPRGANYGNRLTSDKGGRQGTDHDSIFTFINRGPRASKPKGESTTEQSSSSVVNRESASTSGVHHQASNRENAMFFIIKPFSEYDVHKSIKYSTWFSTFLGNRKLNDAYHAGKRMKGHCPVILFFSVNASGQFCGVAEMVGPIDFTKFAGYWQQDRWTGLFSVLWHIIKDVPNSQFRHILLENNGNEPVTYSRDAQEVKLEQGIEMLEIFETYEADTCILDYFNFYDEREKALLKGNARQREGSNNSAALALADALISQEHRPFHGVGSSSSSSTVRYQHRGSYQSSNYGGASISPRGANYGNRLTSEKGGRQERDHDSICIPINQGLMVSNPKDKSTSEQSSLSVFNKAHYLFSQEHRPFHGVIASSSSSTRRYQHRGSYQSSNYGGVSISPRGPNYGNRLTSDNGGRQERDHDSICIPIRRGPRASKPKGKSTSEQSSLSVSNRECVSTSGVHLDRLNHPDFVISYENAKFFIIKSFSEDNVHKSIKYNNWSSTTSRNRKLNDAYHEGKGMKGHCPVFLFFSVNASGRFCGVAEMVRPVDFKKVADYWQQDRWIGLFPVRWHIIKDVPNSQFQHILLENNRNKPVTFSQDTQEVKLEQGIEMLKIFKDYDADTCILDDFDFYDEREKALLKEKARQREGSTQSASLALVDASVNQLSDNFDEALELENRKEFP